MLEKEGFIQESTGSIITLVVGIGIAVLVMMFISVLAGQTYLVVEDEIDYNRHVNATISQTRISVFNSVESSFDAIEATGSYLPIVVLAVVITMVLALILGLIYTGNIGGRGGLGAGAM